MKRLAKDRLATDIYVGLSDAFEREVSEADVLAFAEVSGDLNPLHVDADYAATTKHRRRIVHGAFQVAMASEWVGMHLPGLHVLLSSANARFVAPLYFPTRVKVSGQIVSWDSASASGSAKIVVVDLVNSTTTAEIVMGVSMHESASSTMQAAVERVSSLKVTALNTEGKRVVVVTGASGGLGQEIARSMAVQGYYVLCAGRDREKLAALCTNGNLVPVVQELGEDITEAVARVLGDAKLYAVVHAAWPGAPKGGLLTLDRQVLQAQLDFGGPYLIQLAQLLAARVSPDDGGRLVAIGSTYARLEAPATLPAYSLGKSLLEDTVRMLSSELARKLITANVVAPSFVASGMNAASQDLILKKVAAQVPLGRLCSAGDIAAAVSYLLSSEAGFVSGQVIALTGARR